MESAPPFVTRYPFTTLPDYLAPGLDLVFIGINPGSYSVAKGHYFARSTSRFWPAFSRSRLSLPIRRALAVDRLGPEHDATLLRFGVGFTDVVKRPSANAAGLTPADFAEWAPRLGTRLRRLKPAVACFHGVTAYRPFAAIVLRRNEPPALGLQPTTLGPTRLFVAPNPSPANAHFTVDDQTAFYDQLARVTYSKARGGST